MGQYQHTFTQRLFRMGWLTVCLLGVLLVSTKSMPLEDEIEDQDEIRELFTRLFIEETREGRDLEVEIDNTTEMLKMKRILMNQLWRKNKWKMNLKLTLKWKLTIEQENQNQNRKEIKKIKKKNGKRTRTKKES